MRSIDARTVALEKHLVMYCAECGTQLPETAKFCLECGHKREAAITETSTLTATALEPQLLPHGRAVDPTRDLFGRPLAANETPMLEKSDASAGGTSSGQSPMAQAAEREAAERRATVQRIRAAGPVGTLNQSRTPPFALSPPQRTVSLTPGYLAIAASLLVIVGSLGPWVSIVAPFVGSLTVSGSEGDGKITLVCGITATVLLAFLVTSRQDGVWLGIGAAIALGIAALVGINAWQNLGANIADVSDEELAVLARVGWGLQAMTVGAAVGAVLSIAQAVKATALT